jgi:hypothetical protein
MDTLRRTHVSLGDHRKIPDLFVTLDKVL